MDFDETMVEEEFDEAVEDDTLLEDFVEEDESEDEDFPDEEDLELPDEEEDEEVEEDEEAEPQQPSEPGWIKKRVQKAVDKAVAQALAAQQEQFNQRLAPLIAKMQEDEAQELVRSRKCGDIETARELVRLRSGQSANPSQMMGDRDEQPRNEQGQFASKEQIAEEASVNARINELTKQAAKIRQKQGIDVMEEFNSNEDIKNRVISGELDFYDVAELMSKPRRRKAPAPSRSPNGASNMSINGFLDMSDEAFERMERNLDKGVRYNVK